MTDEFVKLLDQGCVDLGIELSDQQKEQFFKYYEMLIEKNKVMNLTAITDERGVALMHFYDSIIPLSTGYFTPGARVLDIGCGGGFPSLPLAVCAPQCGIVSNDATLKKLAFVRETAAAAGCRNLDILPGRAEELSLLKQYRDSFDTVISRGVARLNVLCEWALPFVKVGGHFIAMKGERGSAEAAEAENAIKLLGGGNTRVTEYEIPDYGYIHTLVVIEKLSPTPQEYPRANGKIMKKPL